MQNSLDRTLVYYAGGDALTFSEAKQLQLQAQLIFVLIEEDLDSSSDSSLYSF